jgi:septation ring formation regulator EzrA
MKDFKSTFLLIVIIGLVGYNIFFLKEMKTDVKSYNSKIDSIQVDIDSVVSANKLLDENLKNIHSEITLIDKDINKVQTNIKTIKETTHEKVRNVDNYAIDELYQFFANRYETRIDSTFKSTGSKTGN